MVGVCNGRPTLNIRVVTEFLTGADGQKLIKSSGAMGLDAVPPAPEYEGY
jgi:hypothetical protein